MINRGTKRWKNLTKFDVNQTWNMIEIYPTLWRKKKFIKKHYEMCTCVKKTIKNLRIDQDWLGHIPTVPCGSAAPAFINFNYILLRSSLKNNFKH